MSTSREDHPLRHAPFRWLVTGTTINLLGSGIAPVALAFAVLDLGGGASELGLVVALSRLRAPARLQQADRRPGSRCRGNEAGSEGGVRYGAVQERSLLPVQRG